MCIFRCPPRTANRILPMRLYLTAMIACMFLTVPSLTFSDDLPFCTGEKLVYELKWGAIPAGTAWIEVLPPTVIKGKPALHFQMRARTNAFVDWFYKVRDRVDSYTDQKMSRSLLYQKKQREGSYKRDIVVRFYWDNLKAQYSNKINGPKEPILIFDGTFDPLSVFYSFRTMDIAEHRAVDRPVTDGVKCVIGEARIAGQEHISVPAGEYDTFLVIPDLRHIGGIFKKSRDAKLHIWVTADHRRIPVKISSKVAVGRFHAELVEHHAPFDCYMP